MKKQLILMLLFSVGFSWAGEPTMKDVLAELKGLKSFRRDTIVTSVVMGKDLEKLTRWHKQLVDIQKDIDTLEELDQTWKDLLAELKGLKSFRRDTIVTSVVMGKDLEKLTRWHEQLVDIQKNIDTLKELDQNSVLEGEHKVMFLGLRNFSKK
jgi:predicted component of type VI protein secretion system